MKQSKQDAKRSKVLSELEFQERLLMINEQHTACVRQDAQLLQSEGTLISEFQNGKRY